MAYQINKNTIFFIFSLIFGLGFSAFKAKAQINQQQEWITNTIDRLYPTKIYVEKKIQTIEVEVGIKRENARIEKTGKKYIYTFNRQGKIESLIEITRQEYNYDTVFTFHYYNKDSRVHIARTFNKGRYTSTYETSDEYNQVTRFLVCQETNLSDDFRFFKLGQQTVIQSESYRYEIINDNQTRKKFLNDNNVIYKEGILYFEGKKKLLKAQDYTFTTTGVRINYTNSFDDKGRLLESFYTSDAAGDLKENTRFSYDANVLTEEKYYRNASMKNQRFYFYNKENQLLESILSKSNNDYLIEILNFNFTFYQ
jgi:hypothetical protein